MAYGCEGGSRGEVEGQPSCPLCLSRDPPSCHNRHSPILTLNTHQGGGGGAASFLFQAVGWKRGRMEGKQRLISPLPAALMSEEFWDLPPPPPRHFWSQAANLLIIATKGWRCDLNSYFESAADLWEPLCSERTRRRESKQDRGRAGLDRHTAEVRPQDGSSSVRWGLMKQREGSTQTAGKNWTNICAIESHYYYWYYWNDLSFNWFIDL